MSNDARGILRSLISDGYILLNHSWRCAYPERYGACDCEAQAAEALEVWLDALRPDEAT